MQRQRGSTIVVVLLLTVLVGGLAAGLHSMIFAYHRTSQEAFARELAFQNAQSGVAYYLAQLATDPVYFDVNPAPQSPRDIGQGAFTLEEVLPGATAGQWEITVLGRHGSTSFRLRTGIGYVQPPMPGGLTVVGSGDPTDNVLDIADTGIVASYDPAIGPLDLANPGTNPGARVRGSGTLSTGSSIHGDLTLTGTLTTSGGSAVTGALDVYAGWAPVADLGDRGDEAVNDSQATNNNAILSLLFGPSWTPIPGPENYGDLNVTAGDFVVPPGTYRIRRLTMSSGATISFDTTAGPSTLVVMGGGTSLSLSSGSALKIAPGGSTHGLLTVLGPDTSMEATGGAWFGHAVGDPYNTAYSEIISTALEAAPRTALASGGSTIWGRVYGPALTLSLTGASTWYGTATVKTLMMSASDNVFGVDEGGGSGVGLPTDFRVHAQWPAPGP